MVNIPTSEKVPMMVTDNPDLFNVLTLPEVALLWGVSRRQVDYAIWRDELSARMSLTGGSWLVSYDSCVSLWGKPSKTVDMAISEVENE